MFERFFLTIFELMDCSKRKHFFKNCPLAIYIDNLDYNLTNFWQEEKLQKNLSNYFLKLLKRFLKF